MSKKETIISYFEKMDINMLELLLDDSKTYQDATKEMFLKKLELLFNDLKNNNDSFLTAYKGKCVSEKCMNSGCKGYSFVGNNSGKHLDLIFEEYKSEFFDIYHCSSLETSNKFNSKDSLLTLEIFDDEMANLFQQLTFLLNIKNANWLMKN